MLIDHLPGGQGDEQWVALNPDGVLFRGPLSPLEQRQDLSGIMDRDDTPGRGYIEFTANYTVWPFNENITADHPDADYTKRIPSDLKERLLRWDTFFVDHHGLTGFAADRLLREFDEEYLRLAEELAILGFRFKLSQWWSR